LADPPVAGIGVGPGPDWRWRFEIQTGESDDFELRMYNITPEGDEALAVRAQYWRLIG